MRSVIVLRSLYPGTPIYTWEAKHGYTLQESTFPLPKDLWISNQTGIQVGTFGSVDIDSLRNLLGALPNVLSDLVLDAAEQVGFKKSGNISPMRWEKLSRPRPLTAEVEIPENTVYAVRGSEVFFLSVDPKGRGGWYKTDKLPENLPEHFEMWDYTVYTPSLETFTLPSMTARRLLTSTLDCLYTYPDDDAMRAYFIWVQDKIKSLWEEANSSREGQGAS